MVTETNDLSAEKSAEPLIAGEEQPLAAAPAVPAVSAEFLATTPVHKAMSKLPVLRYAPLWVEPVEDGVVAVTVVDSRYVVVFRTTGQATGRIVLTESWPKPGRVSLRQEGERLYVTLQPASDQAQAKTQVLTASHLKLAPVANVLPEAERLTVGMTLNLELLGKLQRALNERPDSWVTVLLQVPRSLGDVTTPIVLVGDAGFAVYQPCSSEGGELDRARESYRKQREQYLQQHAAGRSKSSQSSAPPKRRGRPRKSSPSAPEGASRAVSTDTK